MIDWGKIRQKIRSAILSVNPTPVVVHRVVTRGAFDTLTGEQLDDVVQVFTVPAVHVSGQNAVAFRNKLGIGINNMEWPKMQLAIINGIDAIFAADVNFVPEPGDVAIINSERRMISSIEPYRGTFGLALAYGVRFE